MKTIKTLLAASALATITCSANATVWNVSMNASAPLRIANGEIVYAAMTGFTGTWDDTTGQGSWHGTSSLSRDAGTTTAEYDQTFIMSTSTASGQLGAAYNCISVDPNDCLTTGGPMLNTHGSGYTLDNDSYKASYLFTPVDGALLQWTLQFYIPIGFDEELGAPIIAYNPLPMNVTLHAPTVPIPTAAWLFASSLIGLTSAARKRRSI